MDDKILASELLTSEDYKKLAKRVYKIKDKNEIVNFLNDEFFFRSKRNPKFWSKISEAFDKQVFKYYEYEIFDNFSDLQSMDRAELNDIERQVFISGFINQQFEKILEARKWKNRNFSVNDLPAMDEKIKELYNAKGSIREYFNPGYNILVTKFLEIIHRRKNIKEYTTEYIKKEALIVYVKYFFTLSTNNEKEVPKSGLLLIENSSEGEIFHQKIFSTSMKVNAIKIFARGYNTYMQENKHNKNFFSSFKNWEIRKWSELKKYFDEFDNEFDLIEKYLFSIKKITQKKINDFANEKSFGISRKAEFNRLCHFLTELTEEINFIYFDKYKVNGKELDYYTKKKIVNEKVRQAVLLFTTENYDKESIKIYFGCETTTVAYVLNIINNNFGNGCLTYTAIGKSQSFYIPKVKKVSDVTENFKSNQFILLNSNNLIKSFKRFSGYSNTLNRIEYKHFHVIESIKSKLGIK